MRTSWTWLSLAVALSACGGPAYVPLQEASFRTSAPRPVAFDALYRRAAVLGYVYAEVDPQATRFAVHSRVLGRPPRRAQLDPDAAARSDLFVVTVGESAVRVTAVGRHVDSEGRCDPALAQELAIFADSMQRALRSVGGGLLQGDGYGGAPLPDDEPLDDGPAPTSEETTAGGAAGDLSAP